MKTFVIDTHALVWYLDGDPKLSKTVKTILDSKNIQLVVPTIVIAEIKYLFSRRKINITFNETLQYI